MKLIPAFRLKSFLQKDYTTIRANKSLCSTREEETKRTRSTQTRGYSFGHKLSAPTAMNEIAKIIFKRV